MANQLRRARPSAAARRTGYVFGIAFTGVFLYLINVWPGWQAVPFLDADVDQIIGLVNFSLVLGIVFNLVYLVYDPQWLKSCGDLVNAAIGLVVLVWSWNTFPFTFGEDSAWTLITRVLLALFIPVAGIACIVSLVTIVRAAFSHNTDISPAQPHTIDHWSPR